MTERGIEVLATIGIMVSAFAGWGWIGLGVILIAALSIKEHRLHQRQKAWKTRWEVREARWRAGERK
jgi:hypothetical protein